MFNFKNPIVVFFRKRYLLHKVKISDEFNNVKKLGKIKIFLKNIYFYTELCLLIREIREVLDSHCQCCLFFVILCIKKH